MGAIGGMLGLGGGAGGTGFAGPRMPDITDPVTQQQITDSYKTAQSSMQQQQSLLSALQAQNGLANQSQVYNQLQGIVGGTGPNPALAQLNQTTGQNVANQAALMAGQRGAGSNVGLLARQAGQVGANLQQQSVGQAATLEAQQQLNAINAAGNIANTQAGQQISQTNTNVGASQAEQQALLNAQQAFNNAQVGGTTSLNTANAALAGQTMQNQAGLIGGLLSGAGSALGKPSAAKGGELIKHYAEGDAVQGPASKFGQFLSGMNMNQSNTLQKGASNFGSGLMSAFQSPIPSSGTSPDEVMSSSGPRPMMKAMGGVSHDYRGGGKVMAKNQNEMAVKSGDDYANDKIPAVLSEHEIVLPRSVTMSNDPVGESAKFVAATIAKRKMRK